VTGYPFDPSDLAPDETADDFARQEASSFGDEPLSRLKRTEYFRLVSVDPYNDGTIKRCDLTFEAVASGVLWSFGLDNENAINLARFIMDALDPRDTPFSDGLDPVEVPFEDVA
jgi:hypothetical protein